MATTTELTLRDICAFDIVHDCEISVVKDPDGDPNVFGVCLYYDGAGTIATFRTNEADSKPKEEWLDIFGKMLEFVKTLPRDPEKEVSTDD